MQPAAAGESANGGDADAPQIAPAPKAPSKKKQSKPDAKAAQRTLRALQAVLARDPAWPAAQWAVAAVSGGPKPATAEQAWNDASSPHV